MFLVTIGVQGNQVKDLNSTHYCKPDEDAFATVRTGRRILERWRVRRPAESIANSGDGEYFVGGYD